MNEALSILLQQPGDINILPFAGGTDLMPRWSRGLLKRPGAVLDLKGIRELGGIEKKNGEVRLGPCTFMSEIEADPIIRATAPVLARAAGRIACPQIRNRATLGGNLCNASPAADTAIPLILLDAVLDLVSMKGELLEVREIPVAGFFKSPGATALEPGELLVGIRYKPRTEGWFAGWDKFGTRPAMEIAVASVGLCLKLEGSTVAAARVGYGSVAPVPLRGLRAEKELEGRALTAEVIQRCEAAAREEITPITDVRASDGYRREMVGVMLRRMLEGAKSV